MKLPALMAALIDSHPTKVMWNKDVLPDTLYSDIGMSQWNHTLLDMVAGVSNHPVSVYDKHGNISPSTLIPFCSLETEIIGLEVPNMTFPMCNIFDPTVYHGQLCYHVKVRQHQIQRQNIFEGKRSGLMLLIDVNQERSINIESIETSENGTSSKPQIYLGDDKVINENMAIINIGTLAKYTGYGAGDYALTGIKEMTGTDNFLAWPEEKRKCALAKDEDCQKKGFQDVCLKCGCSPFQLLPAVTGTTVQV